MGLITLSLKGDQLLWISDSMINKGYYLNGLARGIFVKIEWRLTWLSDNAWMSASVPSTDSCKVSTSVNSCKRSTTATLTSVFSCESKPSSDEIDCSSTKIGYRSGAVATARSSCTASWSSTSDAMNFPGSSGNLILNSWKYFESGYSRGLIPWRYF